LALQIADSVTDLSVLGRDGRLPERFSCSVLEGDQGGYATAAAAPQIVLAGRPGISNRALGST